MANRNLRDESIQLYHKGCGGNPKFINGQITCSFCEKTFGINTQKQFDQYLRGMVFVYDYLDAINIKRRGKTPKQ